MHEIEQFKEMYYPSIEGEALTRSEGVGLYLIRKYGIVPSNTWINVYARDLRLVIGGAEMTPHVGTEIAFFSPSGPCIGAGIIENRPGLMKFTPIYTKNQYSNGLAGGETPLVYVLGFEFEIAPTLVYSGGYQQFEVKQLSFV